MKMSHILIGFLLLCVSAEASPRKRVYHNIDYGITLPVPNAAQMCPVSSGDTTHHGVTLLLGSKDDKQCGISSKKRWILVWSQYNAVEDSKTLHSFLQWQCQYEAKGQCQALQTELQINGLPSEAARVDYPDGSIQIMVVAQAGKPNPEFDSTVPGNNYELSLHTTPDHFDEDMAVFREILGSIKIAPSNHP